MIAVQIKGRDFKGVLLYNQKAKRTNQGNPNLKGFEIELLNLNVKLNEIKSELLK